MSRYFSEYLPFFGGVAIFNEICSWAPLCWSVSNLGNRIWNQVQKVDLLSCLALETVQQTEGILNLVGYHLKREGSSI